MKILFMGTPDFAVFSLKALVENNENVVAVITQSDKPKGRGYTMTPPPVKVYATEHSIPVYQPEKLRNTEFEALLHSIDPDLIVVTAYGKILPSFVLDYPRFGCVNVHGSLLPEYRGAAPMQRAIIDGKKVTGITTMMMDAGVDTGDMLLFDSIEIEENDNFETVHDKLGACSASLLIKTLEGIKSGSLQRIKQDDTYATYASKIEKADCVIDFSRSAKEVHNRIRGLSPVPLAFTHTPDGKLLKVLTSEVIENESENGDCGRVSSLDGNKITVNCGHGKVALLTVLPEGKGKMSAGDFIRGRKIKTDDILA